MSQPLQEQLDALIARREAIDKEFIPTLTKYQEMAKTALELQVEILSRALKIAFPDARFLERKKVLTISARLGYEKVREMITAVATNPEIQIHEITYDPVTFDYHLTTR
jgi:hypothetical protein